MLSDCGGGSGGSSSSGGGGGGGPVVVVPTGPLMTAPDAVRLADQATFGPTQPLVDHMVTVGVSAWLDEQFAATGSSYTDLAARVVPRNYCSVLTGVAQSNCGRDYQSSIPLAMRFYSNAMSQSDQLRQRVAWSLSQILVASDIEVHSTAGEATMN
jgi:hypothetical protein